MNKDITLEDLGFKCQESYFKEELDEIRYIKNGKFVSCVLFNLNHKCFKIHRFDDEYKSSWCDKDMLQAIYNKCKELGWLDGKNN